MLDINIIRETPDIVRKALQDRQIDPSPVDSILELDAKRRSLLAEAEALKAERNTVSKEISKMKDAAARQEKIDSMRSVGDRIASLDKEIAQVESDLSALTATLPNLPDPRTPYGKDDSENVVLRSVGQLPEFDFTPKPHWDLGPELGILDFERGTKLTGSRFYVLSGTGARLQRALIAWMLDLHTRQGYREQYLPFMVKTATVFGAGQLPKFADNLYKDHEEDYYFVPTAEVPLTGLHMDEILDEAKLPRFYTAYTPCFRREAGSYGKDTRGLIRLHQFNKVELVAFSAPDRSYEELERLTGHAESVLQSLGLPYRVVTLCTGDMGFSAAKTYDIEVWLPSQQQYREISSCSNFESFQARRAGIKYRPSGGKKDAKTDFVHTLNGSGLAVGRTLVAILENYQQPDGSVLVPEALRPHIGGLDRIQRE